MNQAVGIRAIAVSFPSTIRTNDYWRENCPEFMATVEQKSFTRAFSPKASIANDEELDLWTQAIAPYVSDPFRGGVERRVLGPGESSLTLERQAALAAIEAAQLDPRDIDLLLVSSMFPENIEQGNAAFLAGELRLQGAAWNLDSMCASPLVALQTACAFVRAGEYRQILVVTSCTYSRFADETDTLSFFLGDGASAFLVGTLEENQGILGSKVVNTAESCGVFFNELTLDDRGRPRMFIRASQSASQKIPQLFLKYLHECCNGALAAAGVTQSDIDFFIFYTATAWYSRFCVRALGIDPERTIDIYPYYGNISAVSTVASLYHATQLGKIRPNDLVLVYNHGFVASAAAVVMRWGDVALGDAPLSSAKLIDSTSRKGCLQGVR